MIYYKTNDNSKSNNLLVCIPGLASNRKLFSDFIQEIIPLDLYIVLPDLRGCGQSKDIDGEFSVSEAVEDIKEILEQYKNYKVVLLGYSQGGTVAQLFAKNYPNQISGLILCNTFSLNTITIKEKLEGVFSKVFLSLFGLKAFSNLITFGLDEKLPDSKMDYMKQMIRGNKKKAIVAWLKQLTKFDSRSWLKEIRKPCLIIQGEKDKAMPKYHTNMLSNGIPNSKTIFVENAGHVMILSNTKQFAKVVYDNYSLFM